MAKKYVLNPDSFDAVINEFVESSENLGLTKESKSGQILYRFKKQEDKKPCSILTCYISEGKTSFSFGGTDPLIAEKCSLKLIEETSVIIQNRKTFTIKPAAESDVNTIIDFLVSEHECTEEIVEPTDKNISKVVVIKGKFGDTIRITLYKTGTLLVQGQTSFIFQNFIEIATELFNPLEIKKEHFKLFEIEESSPIINSDLSAHLPHAYESLGEKLDAIMAPSLILLNTALELTDYSSFAFPILRGTEGVLKTVFNNEGIPLKEFGEYFKFDNSKGKCEWAKDCSSLFTNEKYRRKLLELYRFYHQHRHTTFHVDATISTSRTLQYEEALSIVQDGLKLIDDLYFCQN